MIGSNSGRTSRIGTILMAAAGDSHNVGFCRDSREEAAVEAMV